MFNRRLTALKFTKTKLGGNFTQIPNHSYADLKAT